jgi:phosphate transport system permease protein
MNSLPLYAFFAVRSGQPNLITRGYGAACVLLTIVLILFVIVRLLARQRGGQR